MATLSTNNTTLTFEPHKWRVKVRVNLARFLPRLFRSVSITPEKEKETLPEGFRKIYPAANGSNQDPNKIIYL